MQLVKTKCIDFVLRMQLDCGYDCDAFPAFSRVDVALTWGR